MDCDKGLPHIDSNCIDKPDYHLNFDFENAVFKLQRGCENDLTDAEKGSLKLFRRDDDVPSATLSSDDGYAARILNNINVRSSVYTCTDHVSPTSNCVERLFSMCKRTMSSLRKNMGPESLDGTVLLRLNSDLWIRSAAQIIQEIMNEEAEVNRAARNLTSPDVSDISADIDQDLDL